jgi:hypothetical protein
MAGRDRGGPSGRKLRDSEKNREIQYQGRAMISWGPGAELLFGPQSKFFYIILLYFIKKLLVNYNKIIFI